MIQGKLYRWAGDQNTFLWSPKDDSSVGFVNTGDFLLFLSSERFAYGEDQVETEGFLVIHEDQVGSIFLTNVNVDDFFKEATE